MAKAIIVYESKYGNTKLVAEAIVSGIKEISGAEPILAELKKVRLDQITDFDAIEIGSPNHMGSATRSVRKFIDSLGKLNLEGKYVAVFDTYMSSDFEKAVKKMEKQISEKVPQLKLAVPGLSIRVKGMRGPIDEGEIPKCKEFGVKIAKQII